MLLCNYVLTPTLKSTLALSSTSAAVKVSPALLASASIVIVAFILVVHLVPLLLFSPPASGRRAWRVILALDTVGPKQVIVAAFDLQLTLDLILRTLKCD